jgi:hypothetical protein
MVDRLVRVGAGHLDARRIANGFAVTVRFPAHAA